MDLSQARRQSSSVSAEGMKVSDRLAGLLMFPNAAYAVT